MASPAQLPIPFPSKDIELNDVEVQVLTPLFIQRAKIDAEITKLSNLIIARAGDPRNRYAYDPREKKLKVVKDGK